MLFPDQKHAECKNILNRIPVHLIPLFDGNVTDLGTSSARENNILQILSA